MAGLLLLAVAVVVLVCAMNAGAVEYQSTHVFNSEINAEFEVLPDTLAAGVKAGNIQAWEDERYQDMQSLDAVWLDDTTAGVLAEAQEDADAAASDAVNIVKDTMGDARGLFARFRDLLFRSWTAAGMSWGFDLPGVFMGAHFGDDGLRRIEIPEHARPLMLWVRAMLVCVVSYWAVLKIIGNVGMLGGDTEGSVL